jgi:hypothetical protein
LLDSPEFSEAVKAGKIVVIAQDNQQIWCFSAQDEEQIVSLKNHLNIPRKEGVNIWVDSDSRLNQHLKEVSEAAWDVFDATEGEITLILPLPRNIAKSALFEDDTVAITYTKEQWARKMMQLLKSPLAILKSTVGYEDLAIDLKGKVYVLNLPAQMNQSAFQGYSIIKLAEDGGIKIIRSQGQKLFPHI